MNKIMIKNSLNEYCDDFCNLINLSGGEYLEYAFTKNVTKALRKLYFREKNLFSHTLVDFAFIDNNLCGMILAYNYEKYKKYILNTAFLISKFCGLKLLFQINRTIKCTNQIGNIEPDEYYISDIAVYEKYRNKGIGKFLLEEIEKKAYLSKCNKIILDVEEKKDKAISLYEKNNFIFKNENIINFNDGYKFNFLRFEKSLNR